MKEKGDSGAYTEWVILGRAGPRDATWKIYKQFQPTVGAAAVQLLDRCIRAACMNNLFVAILSAALPYFNGNEITK